MSVDIVDDWLRSGQYANIDGELLRPKKHPLLETALSVVRGQARVFYLENTDGQGRVLKKFVPAMKPDHAYIASIRSLIPKEQGFESGFHRKTLQQNSLLYSNKNGVYYSSGFATWLQDTILMPQIQADNWSVIIDRIRNGTLQLTIEQRLRLCEQLLRKVKYLESTTVSHRDLSSQNIFIDRNGNVHFIDWDCLYHPNLAMPTNTTFGTSGYIAPFVNQDVQKTWCEYADRFSLAVLIAEFLTAVTGAPLGGDGGMFDQGEIDARGGKNVIKILSDINQQSPVANDLFQKALYASSFTQMPSPQSWTDALPSLKTISQKPDPLWDHQPIKTITFVAQAPASSPPPSPSAPQWSDHIHEPAPISQSPPLVTSSTVKSPSGKSSVFFACLAILILLAIIYFASAQNTGLTIDSVSYWQATGVDLSRNSIAYIGYNSGAWTVDSNIYGTVGPEGYPADVDAQIWNPLECKILQSAPYGALLGKIGNGPVFEIGRSKVFWVSDEGELYLSMNDDYQCLADNQGEISVTIVSH